MKEYNLKDEHRVNQTNAYGEKEPVDNGGCCTDPYYQWNLLHEKLELYLGTEVFLNYLKGVELKATLEEFFNTPRHARIDYDRYCSQVLDKLMK